MNRKYLLILAILGTGCGVDYQYDCSVPWGSYTSQHPVNCTEVYDIFTAARKFLTLDGTQALKDNLPARDPRIWLMLDNTLPGYNHKVISNTEFSRLFKGINVHEVSEDSYKLGGEEVWGNYDLFTGIQISRGHLCVLTHELTHGVEVSRWQLSTVSHKDWDKKGHTEKTIAFKWYTDMQIDDPDGYLQ